MVQVSTFLLEVSSKEQILENLYGIHAAIDMTKNDNEIEAIKGKYFLFHENITCVRHILINSYDHSWNMPFQSGTKPSKYFGFGGAAD